MTTLTPSLIELASWTLATELMRRAPKLLRIVETHPGGGQYDCLSIIRTDRNLHLCALNRLGSFTAFGRFDSGHDCSSQIDVWDRIARGDSTRILVDEICRTLHLPGPSPLPAATNVSLTYRVITAMLRTKTFSPVRWSCLNGFHDSSGFEGCGIRNDLFSAFPTVQVPLSSEKSKDSSLSRATDFWFFCCKDEPIICFEIAGRAYSTKGVMIELQPKYARRRSIYDVVAELHARFFGDASNLSI
jgi:type III secretion system-like peptide-binding chaperone